jgi:spore cortex formation protein SpoVR/YcgB (stage V sporulation)
MQNPLFIGYDWDINLIEKLWKRIDFYGKKMGLDYYPPKFEVITSEQMIDAYSSNGMPIYYNHWSFGKNFIKTMDNYKKGKMGLAYEMVINSNPCLAYLMEDNTATLTAMVISHASCGHSHFFKNNYLFKKNTNPESIINLLESTKKYILKCEEQYGFERVENLISCIHFLSKFGINKYPRCNKTNDKLIREREEYYRQSYDPIINNHLFSLNNQDIKKENNLLIENIDEENLIKFIIDHSLSLEIWQKNILNLIMSIEQYFYPQSQTKIMNEGFACFIHYHIMEELYKNGDIDEGSYIEFIKHHTDVCYQPELTSINPYALGFEIFMDIKRSCLYPDEEDYIHLSTSGSKDWMVEIKNVVKYYKDESFITQFLSPKVIRKLGLFSYHDSSEFPYVEITGTQDDCDIMTIREQLCNYLKRENFIPDLEIISFNKVNNRVIIKYNKFKNREIYNFDIFEEVFNELTGLTVNLEESENGL